MTGRAPLPLGWMVNEEWFFGDSLSDMRLVYRVYRWSHWVERRWWQPRRRKRQGWRRVHTAATRADAEAWAHDTARFVRDALRAPTATKGHR